MSTHEPTFTWSISRNGQNYYLEKCGNGLFIKYGPYRTHEEAIQAGLQQYADFSIANAPGKTTPGK